MKNAVAVVLQRGAATGLHRKTMPARAPACGKRAEKLAREPKKAPPEISAVVRISASPGGGVTPPGPFGAPRPALIFAEGTVTQTCQPAPELASDWFQQHYTWLARRMGGKTGCRFGAEDIASEAFAQLLQRPGWQDTREPRALLTTIAQRLLYDIWRRRDLEEAYVAWAATQPQATLPSPEDRALILETLTTIDRMLDGLSAKARTAFLYSQLDGLTYPEIAQRLQVSVRMVQKYMTQAMRLCYLADLS
jgi:RNA polymerase sigma-70 factor (ECF subfamily)